MSSASTTPVRFITGVSTSFGCELALCALGHGRRVIGTVRSKTHAADAVAEIEGRSGHIVELDLTDSRDSIVEAITQAEEIHGQIDILINNAGYSIQGVVEGIT